MTATDPLGRLIWVGVRGAEPGDPALEADLDACARVGVGGVILFDVDAPARDRLMAEGAAPEDARRLATRNVLSPDQLRRLTDHLRARLGGHLIVSVDQEGGAVARLGPSRGFPETPSARAYAAMDARDRARAAAGLASTLAGAGIDLNLAPCVDVELAPDGPAIGALGRSFGADPRRVAALAGEQMDALRAGGLASCLKHFPGHGSAAGDTHLADVDITLTFDADAELAPYRALLGPDRPCAAAPDAVLVGHMIHRGLDAALPCSLSPRVIGGLLRGELGFDGVVITDALDMRAVAGRFRPGEASVLAILAGADAALDANNLGPERPCPAPEMLDALRVARRDGRLHDERIGRSLARLESLGRRRAGAAP